jgi:hypothetical protein
VQRSYSGFGQPNVIWVTLVLVGDRGETRQFWTKAVHFFRMPAEGIPRTKNRPDAFLSMHGRV